LSRRLSGGTITLGDNKTKCNSLLSSTLPPENNLEMSRSGNIQEVLRVPAPELVVSSLIINSSSTSSVDLPTAGECLLKSVGHLD
jgi:hypothetical protein